jgi:predicted glutamine amidotransferase
VCRLFAMSAGRRRAQATFWLLDAPDSLARQSRAEPDGAGLGHFTADDRPSVYRTVLAAYEDSQFAAESREVESKTFVAHIRYASTGAVALENTHPFEQDGRLFAHNGVVGDLPKLEAALGNYRSLVHGETDSERFFALITCEADRADGDLTTAITTAARWVARELPLYALNLVLATPDGIWALRYPDTHDLFVLERPAGGSHGHRHFEGASAAGRIRVRSANLAEAPAVIVASERVDEHPGWRNLASGELIHVDADLNVHSTMAISETPAHPLRLQDLDSRAAISQQPPHMRA